MLLMAKVNPPWLPVVVLGRLHKCGQQDFGECYGYKVTRHIPVGDVLINEGIHPQQA